MSLFDLPLLGADFVVNTTVFGNIASAPAQILGQNPNRWALVIGTGGGGTIFIGPKNPSPTSTGFQIASTQVPLAINFRDFGALVQVPWYCFTGGAVALYVVEVLYLPSGGQ